MAVLLAIGFVACAIWAAWLVPRMSLIALAAAYLIAAAVVGYDIWNMHVGISISVDRLFLIALVGCFAAQPFCRVMAQSCLCTRTGCIPHCWGWDFTAASAS